MILYHGTNTESGSHLHIHPADVHGIEWMFERRTAKQLTEQAA